MSLSIVRGRPPPWSPGHACLACARTPARDWPGQAWQRACCLGLGIARCQLQFPAPPAQRTKHHVPPPELRPPRLAPRLLSPGGRLDSPGRVGWAWCVTHLSAADWSGREGGRVHGDRESGRSGLKSLPHHVPWQAQGWPHWQLRWLGNRTFEVFPTFYQSHSLLPQPPPVSWCNCTVCFDWKEQRSELRGRRRMACLGHSGDIGDLASSR